MSVLGAKIRGMKAGFDDAYQQEAIEILAKQVDELVVASEKTEWIKVSDRLPEIPEGKYAVGVIAVVYDRTYEEMCGNDGRTVAEVHWDGKNWKNALITLKGEFAKWATECDEVTHWMPLPEMPTKECYYTPSMPCQHIEGMCDDCDYLQEIPIEKRKK